MHARRPSQGKGLPTLASTRTGQQNVPSRTTKVSEKLVLIPEAPDDREGEGESDEELARQASMLRSAEDENRPLRDEELDVLRKRGGIRGKSYAERLPKMQRGEKVARLTAYCTAQAYKMKATAEFLKTKHEAKTKLYDDCLYTAYHLPLLPGVEGFRLRSRPILKTPGTGKTVLDLEIERSERRDYHEGFWEEYSLGAQGMADSPTGGPLLQPAGRLSDTLDRSHDGSGQLDGGQLSVGPINRLVPDAKNLGEMFVFSYGVVVFWNFTEKQEKDILADLTFAENENGLSLVTRPLDEDDFETEEFHFEYSPDVKRPRVFNDMITLLPRSDHMVKLTISHAIAQSTKLCFFEERMSETMLDAQHVPKRLALTGQLDMTRTEIVKILGRLFKSRVDINLCKSLSLLFIFLPTPPPTPTPPLHSAPCPFPKQPRLTDTHPPLSLQRPRRAQLLLGLGADAAPALRGHPRVPRDRPAHQGAQRALPRLPRPGRHPGRQRRRRQDEQHHLDHHHPHLCQHHRHRHRGRPALRHPLQGQGQGGGRRVCRAAAAAPAAGHDGRCRWRR